MFLNEGQIFGFPSVCYGEYTVIVRTNNTVSLWRNMFGMFSDDTETNIKENVINGEDVLTDAAHYVSVSQPTYTREMISSFFNFYNIFYKVKLCGIKCCGHWGAKKVEIHYITWNLLPPGGHDLLEQARQSGNFGIAITCKLYFMLFSQKP